MADAARDDTHPARVGVRELRQNLSVYLDRVKAGETLEVTERGVPVAELHPLPEGSDVIQRLVSAGRAWPAEASMADLPAPIGEPSVALSRKIKEALDAQGEDAV